MAKKQGKREAKKQAAERKPPRKQSEDTSATPESTAKDTVGGGVHNIVFRMPPELSAPPSEVAGVLRRTAARIRKLTEYIRAFHVETEGGYYSHTLSSHPATRRLLNDVDIGLMERNWDNAYEARRALEPGRVDQGRPWQSAELNHEPVYYAGEYDLGHPANAPLVDAAFPPDMVVGDAKVIRPQRVHVYIRPDYPELGDWSFRWMMLSLPLHNWFDGATPQPAVLSGADVAKLEEYAAWSERFAGCIEIIGEDERLRTQRVLTEAALKRLQESSPSEPLPDDVHWAVLRHLRDKGGRPTKEQVRDAVKGFGRHLIRGAISDMHRWEWVHAPPKGRKGVGLMDAGRRALEAEERRLKTAIRD